MFLLFLMREVRIQFHQPQADHGPRSEIYWFHKKAFESINKQKDWKRKILQRDDEPELFFFYDD